MAVSSDAIGFIASAVAIICFGSNLVPVKHVETGDGMFYQWIMCSAAWAAGLIINLFRNSPTFYPLAMLGGFLWATGNITVVPILKTVGLGPGLLIWSSVNMITGWASGHFGWFGLHPDKIANPTLNYIGFALSLLRLVIFFGITPDPEGLKRKQLGKSMAAVDGQVSLLNNDENAINFTGEGSRPEVDSAPVSASDASWVDNLSLLQKRVIGCILSLIAGCLYGLNFVPCIWIQENKEDASQNGLDYVFAHFCGIYVTSTAYFLVYSAYKRNRPQFTEGLVIPSMASGVMWAVAQAGWFVANSTLSESVSFPIVTTGPSIIAALWSVLYFREIRGTRNYVFLIVAMAVASAGVALTALSKE